jgi:hypothetical protein
MLNVKACNRHSNFGFSFSRIIAARGITHESKGKKYTSDTLVKWENKTNMFKNNKTYKQITALEKNHNEEQANTLNILAASPFAATERTSA